ncbi:MAG TPA: hypothetical protein VIY48_15720 [Candidatus Paceibacterota bacterium]
MASAKSRRYGQGGSKHKHTPNVDRPNGKAWKQHPKGFSYTLGRLVATKTFKGASFNGSY